MVQEILEEGQRKIKDSKDKLTSKARESSDTKKSSETPMTENNQASSTQTAPKPKSFLRTWLAPSILFSRGTWSALWVILKAWLMAQPRHFQHLFVAACIAWAAHFAALFFAWSSNPDGPTSTIAFQPLNFGAFITNGKPLNFDPWLFSESLLLTFGFIMLVACVIPATRRLASLFLIGKTLSLIPYYIAISTYGWDLPLDSTYAGFYLRFISICFFLVATIHAFAFAKNEFGRGALYPIHRTRPSDIALTSLAGAVGIGFLLYRFFPALIINYSLPSISPRQGYDSSIAGLSTESFGTLINTEFTSAEALTNINVVPEVMFWGIGLFGVVFAVTLLRRRASVPFLLGLGVYPFTLLTYLIYLDYGHTSFPSLIFDGYGGLGSWAYFTAEVGSGINILAGTLFLLGLLVAFAAISSGTPDERGRKPSNGQLKFKV